MKVIEIDTTIEPRSDESKSCGHVYTILLVDDEKLVRMVAKRRLSKLNHRMLEAKNGKDALEILEREEVDLVLSDWMMPEFGWAWVV